MPLTVNHRDTSMKNSRIAPILVGALLIVLGGLWVWNIMTIDYTRMDGVKPAVEAAGNATAG